MSIAEISLAASVGSAGVARRFLAVTLSGWRVVAYREDAILLLSELVANSALHAKTEIGVRIELKPDCLRLSVTDGSPREPVLRHYSDQSTTGRGLTLVTALARRWGVDPNPGGGKTVWAEVGVEGFRRASTETSPELRILRGGTPASPRRACFQGEAMDFRRGA